MITLVLILFLARHAAAWPLLCFVIVVCDFTLNLRYRPDLSHSLKWIRGKL